MAEEVECAVIGAGVVGLAIARKLAMAGREVIILERNPWIGNETSSRNNEVIHAGFLYPPGSLQARLCRPGAEAMIAYCHQRGVDFAAWGKLVLAFNDQEEGLLHRFMKFGEAAGIEGLELLNPAGVKSLEPEIECQSALYSPATGVVDSHALMLSYQGDAEDAGAAIVFKTTVSHGNVADRGISLTAVDENGGETELDCRTVVNSAGLGAREFAANVEGISANCIPDFFMSKGNYMSLTGKRPFEHIVVPVGLLANGAAFTIDTGGGGKFGPDQEWVTEINYDVPEGLEAKFTGAIRKYHPAFDGARISPDYAGIRPRVWGPDDPPGDWRIDGPRDHGVSGLVNLFGIETPGLTASLAIADYVAELLEG